jgi:hypothetical protein
VIAPIPASRAAGTGRTDGSALARAREPFAALHDLVWLHVAPTNVAGIEARLYEVWAAEEEDDPGVRLLLSLGARGSRAMLWDLGFVAESALGVTSEAPGRLSIAVEPRLDGKDPRRTIDVRYSIEGAAVGAILRVGSRLIARSATEDAEPFASVERVHDAELDGEDFIHARLFERSHPPSVLLQLSGPTGETCSFDLGIDLDVSALETDDERTLFIRGRADGARVELAPRHVEGKHELSPRGDPSPESVRRHAIAR